MGIVQAVAAGGSMELMGTVTPRSKWEWGSTLSGVEEKV
jgi:hypothetical protein